MVKTATVVYKPTKADVTDTITASYNSKNLISKEFYIAPLITFKWDYPTMFYADEKTNCGVIHFVSNVTRVTVTNFKIVDEKDTVVLESESQTLVNADGIDFDYTASASQKDTGVTFKISFTLKDYSFEYTIDTIPVHDKSEGDYNLTVKEGKLVYNTEGHVVLSSDNTGIGVGETINFTSEQGLNVEGKMEES